MTSAAEFQVKVQKSETNMDRFDQMVNGGANATVQTDFGTVPSMAKAIGDFQNAAEDALGGYGDVAQAVVDAQAAATQTAEDRAQSTAAAATASEAADVAVLAEAGAVAASNMFPDTAAGLAATAEGGYFSVPDTDGDFALLYRKSSGAAVEINTYPSKAGALNRANHTGLQPIDTVTGLQSALDAAKDRAQHTGTQAIATVDGLPDALDTLQVEIDDRVRKLPATLRLTDYIFPADTDATEGFYRWIEALNDLSEPYVYGIVPSGAYSLASSDLASEVPTITRDGVSIVGEGKPTITVTGTATIAAVLRFLNSAGRVQGARFVGNSQGSEYVNGSALWFITDALAEKATEFVEVVDCDFDNFKSPYWVFADVSSTDHGIDRVRYIGNTVISRSGNSVTPSSQGMISAALVVKSKVDATDGGGGVRNVLIADNVIDASYIKTGIFCADKVQGGTISRNKVIGAGEMGATDAAGAYAFAAYDSDGVGMRDINFLDNEVDGVRSCGVYCAGVVGLTIRNTVGRNQTDTNEIDLPKGLVVLSGCDDFVVDGVKGDAIAANGVYVIPRSTPGVTTRGVIRNVYVTNSAKAVFAKSAYNPSTIEFDGIYARECSYGLLAAMDDSGMLKWTVTRFNIVSSVAGSYGVRFYTEQTGTGIESLNIGGGSSIDTVANGLDISGMQTGKITIDGITFNNSFATAGLLADGARNIVVDNLTFNNQGATGNCLRLSGARGHLGLGIKFNGVAAGHLIAISGSDLGTETPTFSANASTIVKNLAPAAGGLTHWINVGGGTTWKPVTGIAA